MRNWLRKLFGAESDSSVKSLAATLGQENGAVVQRLNSIEVIDGVKKKGILGEIATPLERCVVRLADESAAHTEIDDAILKRLLAVEQATGFADGSRQLSPTIPEFVLSLDTKHTATTKLMDQLLTNVNEYRKEVQAVKEKQNSVRVYDRDIAKLDKNWAAQKIVNNDFIDIVNVPEAQPRKSKKPPAKPKKAR